ERKVSQNAEADDHGRDQNYPELTQNNRRGSSARYFTPKISRAHESKKGKHQHKQRIELERFQQMTMKQRMQRALRPAAGAIASRQPIESADRKKGMLHRIEPEINHHTAGAQQKQQP